MKTKFTLSDINTPDFARAVHTRLKCLCKLPDTGIVAGQSVASIIYSLINGTSTHINDIDIFVKDNDWQQAAILDDGFSTKVPHTTSKHISNDTPVTDKTFIDTAKKYRRVVDDEYDGRRIEHVSESRYYLSLYHHFNYVISDSIRDGIINTVKVQSYRFNALNIISFFDLNCTMAAYDLSDNTVYTTQAFRDYVKSNQIHVETLHSPARTALRLVRKTQELSSYANVDIALGMLCTSSAMQAAFRPHNRPELITAKTKALFEKYSDALEPYFDIEPYEFETKKRDFETGDEFVIKIDDLYAVIPKTTPVFAFRKELMKNPLFTVDDHEYTQSEQQCYFMNTYRQLTGQVKKKSLERYNIWLKDFIESDKQTEAHELAAIQLGAFAFDSEIKSTHLAYIGRLIYKHTNLDTLFNRLPLHVAYQGAKLIKKLVKQHGGWIYGLFETQGHPEWFYNHQHIDAVIAKHIKLREAPLRDVVLDTYQDGDYTVTELSTTGMLETEGEYLSHCVGGYANSIEHGYSRIFSLRHPDKLMCSTIQVSTPDDHQLVTKGAYEHTQAQHRGYCNQTPCEQALIVAERLLHSLDSNIEQASSAKVVSSKCARLYKIVQSRLFHTRIRIRSRIRIHIQNIWHQSDEIPF